MRGKFGRDVSSRCTLLFVFVAGCTPAPSHDVTESTTPPIAEASADAAHAAAIAPSATPTTSATPPPSTPAVVWNTGNGWTTLTVERDGTATYLFHPSGWGAANRTPVTTRLSLSPTDLDALTKKLAAQDACKLHASGRLPVPEEHTQELTLGLPGLACTVSMLSNDWSRDPHAQPVAQALDDLTERVRRDGKPVK